MKVVYDRETDSLDLIFRDEAVAESDEAWVLAVTRQSKRSENISFGFLFPPDNEVPTSR